MATKTAMSDQEYKQRFKADLGDTFDRAKWIGSTDDHEDHAGQTLATRNHDVITKWAEERDAQPAAVPGTEHGGRPGVLRFDFPGGRAGNLDKVGWERWFETFDTRDLVMLFQEHMSSGAQSNFLRFISPHREAG